MIHYNKYIFSLIIVTILPNCNRKDLENSGNSSRDKIEKLSAFETGRPNQAYYARYFKPSFFALANSKTDSEFLNNYPVFSKDHHEYHLKSSPFSKLLLWIIYANERNFDIEAWMAEITELYLKIYDRVRNLEDDGSLEIVRSKFASAVTGYDTTDHESHTEGALSTTVKSLVDSTRNKGKF